MNYNKIGIYIIIKVIISEGLPGVWGNKGTWPISRGTEKKNLREHGNLETVLRITGTNIVNIVKGIWQKQIERKT